jgi:hypothetical protein
LAFPAFALSIVGGRLVEREPPLIESRDAIARNKSRNTDRSDLTNETLLEVSVFSFASVCALRAMKSPLTFDFTCAWPEMADTKSMI